MIRGGGGALPGRRFSFPARGMPRGMSEQTQVNAADPDEYKGEPIPGGPSDPDAPPDPAMVGEEEEDSDDSSDSDDDEKDS